MRFGRVEVTPGFLVLAAWLNYMDDQGILLPVLCSCGLHELGHLLLLRLMKNDVKQIRITAVGAEIQVRKSMSYLGEMAAALAGPGVNLALAGLLCRVPGGEMAAGLNLVLGCFNLLPVGQLDGGRAIKCLLSLLLGPELGEELWALSTRGVLLMIGAAGLWLAWAGGNLSLTLVGAWMLLTAGGAEINGRRWRKKSGNRACQGYRKKVK